MRHNPTPARPTHVVLRRAVKGYVEHDICRLLAQVRVDVANVAHHEAVPTGADFARVFVVDRGDVKAALAEPGVLDQRTADASRTHEHHPVSALQTQDVADLRGELGDPIPEAPRAEGAEAGNVLAHMHGGRAAA